MKVSRATVPSPRELEGESRARVAAVIVTTVAEAMPAGTRQRVRPMGPIANRARQPPKTRTRETGAIPALCFANATLPMGSSVRWRDGRR